MSKENDLINNETNKNDSKISKLYKTSIIEFKNNKIFYIITSILLLVFLSIFSINYIVHFENGQVLSKYIEDEKIQNIVLDNVSYESLNNIKKHKYNYNFYYGNHFYLSSEEDLKAMGYTINSELNKPLDINNYYISKDYAEYLINSNAIVNINHIDVILDAENNNLNDLLNSIIYEVDGTKVCAGIYDTNVKKPISYYEDPTSENKYINIPDIVESDKCITYTNRNSCTSFLSKSKNAYLDVPTENLKTLALSKLSNCYVLTKDGSFIKYDDKINNELIEDNSIYINAEYYNFDNSEIFNYNGEEIESIKKYPSISDSCYVANYSLCDRKTSSVSDSVNIKGLVFYDYQLAKDYEYNQLNASEIYCNSTTAKNLFKTIFTTSVVLNLNNGKNLDCLVEDLNDDFVIFNSIDVENLLNASNTFIAKTRNVMSIINMIALVLFAIGFITYCVFKTNLTKENYFDLKLSGISDGLIFIKEFISDLLICLIQVILVILVNLIAASSINASFVANNVIASLSLFDFEIILRMLILSLIVSLLHAILQLIIFNNCKIFVNKESKVN